MSNFHMAALMFLTGHGIKARTRVCAENAHFLTQCIMRMWKALSPRASQTLMMHLVVNCAISTQAWILLYQETMQKRVMQKCNISAWLP